MPAVTDIITRLNSAAVTAQGQRADKLATNDKATPLSGPGASLSSARNSSLPPVPLPDRAVGSNVSFSPHTVGSLASPAIQRTPSASSAGDGLTMPARVGPFLLGIAKRMADDVLAQVEGATGPSDEVLRLNASLIECGMCVPPMPGRHQALEVRQGNANAVLQQVHRHLWSQQAQTQRGLDALRTGLPVDMASLPTSDAEQGAAIAFLSDLREAYDRSDLVGKVRAQGNLHEKNVHAGSDAAVHPLVKALLGTGH